MSQYFRSEIIRMNNYNYNLLRHIDINNIKSCAQPFLRSCQFLLGKMSTAFN